MIWSPLQSGIGCNNIAHCSALDLVPLIELPWNGAASGVFFGGKQLWLTHPVGLSQTTGIPSAYHPIALQWSNLAERASVLAKQKQT